ncbi:uncharacterized protein LOC128642615 isoform X2 [Bombina bombina]|uniref:uncharacterized protein LOC128642615 isoform X2 n=1 Tax=Bombina bombina TaxID=8345 RepID=UPI00235B1242|nr:uncharacterized protein LOC128642615 isoform X2 [Bombina bombina]
MNHWYIQFFFYLGLALGDTSGCIRVNPCKCLMKDGSGVINLAALGEVEGFLVRDRKVHLGSEGSRTENLATFSPCNAFTEPAGLGNCSRMAVCVVSRNLLYPKRFPQYIGYGQHEDNEFNYSNDSKILSVTYPVPGSPLRTIVHFNCSPTSSVTFPWNPESPDLLEIFVQSPCVCPNRCQSKDVGPTTIILILFITSSALYFLYGDKHKSSDCGTKRLNLLCGVVVWVSVPRRTKTSRPS